MTSKTSISPTQVRRGDALYLKGCCPRINQLFQRPCCISRTGGRQHNGFNARQRLQMSFVELSCQGAIAAYVPDVRHICNEVTHEIEASERLTHPKTYFVVMQTHDLLKAAEKTLCCA
jgi:hypothetical protein